MNLLRFPVCVPQPRVPPSWFQRVDYNTCHALSWSCHRCAKTELSTLMARSRNQPPGWCQILPRDHWRTPWKQRTYEDRKCITTQTFFFYVNEFIRESVRFVISAEHWHTYRHVPICTTCRIYIPSLKLFDVNEHSPSSLVLTHSCTNFHARLLYQMTPSK